MPENNINKTGGGGVRRLIFTGNVKTTLFNKYTPGSGVGALNRSVRRALVRKASVPNCKGFCSNTNGQLVWTSMGRYAYYKQFVPTILTACERTFRDALGPGTSVVVAAIVPDTGGTFQGFTLCAPDRGDSGSVSPFRGIVLLASLPSNLFVIYTTSSATVGTITINGVTFDLTVGATPTDVGSGITQWIWSGAAGASAPSLAPGSSYNLTTTF